MEDEQMTIVIPNTAEGKAKLQSLLHAGWNIYFTFPAVESDKGVMSAIVLLRRNYKQKPIEYGYYNL